MIMSEDPLVVGPCQGCKPMCLGCYKLLVSDMENMASRIAKDFETVSAQSKVMMQMASEIGDVNQARVGRDRINVEKSVPATLVTVEQKDVPVMLVAVEQKNVPATLVAVEQKNVPATLVAVEQKDVPATLVAVEQKDVPATCCKCGWPMCGPDCQGLNTEFGHSMHECAILASCEVGRHLTQDQKAQYSAIVPLRCLLMKHHKPDKWKVLCTMESHNEVRRKLPNIWQNNQSSVVDRIRELWGVRQYSEEEIHTVCGVLEVNAFEVGQHGVSVRALYPTAFYLAHSCVPNTSHTDDDNYKLTVRCSSQIKKGETITLSYAYTLQGTLKRREHLKESKFFDCCCPRCKDPTELATYAGALKCPKCDSGYVISSEPLERAASWRCSQCSNYTVTAHSVLLLLERIADEVEALDVNGIEAMEGFLQKYRNVLHPNHYHCLGVKHSLSQLYGKIQGYMINELPDKLLHRKRDVCRELLRVINVLEPGYSRLRGIILYELHAPLMILITRGFDSRAFSKKDLRKHLKEVVDCLEEANVILSFEPPNSSEGEMAASAKEALIRISDWQDLVGKI
uniref:(California timema) hypothetical protein n=1 Tax=Timema californicum TaxID=61474 RepID=A0A7R9IWV7_TIMCA|nr:unnamed protein product [Timema californicum]